MQERTDPKNRDTESLEVTVFALLGCTLCGPLRVALWSNVLWMEMAVLALLGCALCAMIVALWSIRLWMQWSTGIRSSTQRPSMLRRFGPPAPEHVPQDWKSLYIQVNDIFQIIARKCALGMDHDKQVLGQALHQR